MIYFEAAKLIANSKADYACIAIAEILENTGNCLISSDAFVYYFRPLLTSSCAEPWWEKDVTPKSQLARSIALLFMHEMEKDNVL